MFISVNVKIKKILLLITFTAVFVLPNILLAVPEKLSVYVTIPPQKFFVESIGGERVVAHVLIDEGQSPHTFEPTPHQMIALAKADIFFEIGLPFEKRLSQKVAEINKEMIIVDTSSGVSFLTTGSGEHRDGHPHDHLSDAHTWMDPLNVKIEAENIANALKKRDPSHRGYSDANLKVFLSNIDRLNSEIKDRLMPYEGKVIYTYHPAFGYYTKAYGLVQMAIEKEGKEPGAKDLIKLIEYARERDIRTIFIEPQFLDQYAEKIADSINGEVVKLNPLAEDYIKNMEYITDKVIYSFKR